MAAPRPFQLLIKPASADCNLRCAYCFYLRAQELYPDQARHVMPDDVQEQMIRNLLEYRFPQTVFAWQGGEPTLCGLDFFRRAVALQQKCGASGQSVGNALQTNGMLLDEEWCRFFHEYRFLIGLSLDGPQEVHDRFRVNLSGRGSWEQVMRAAELMNRHRVEFNILCVVNDRNVEMGADLLRWYVDQGFFYLQFIPCVEAGYEHSVPPEKFGAFLCDIFDFWAKDGFGRVSIRDFDAMLAHRMGQGQPMCTFGRVCNHYVVVEHNGDVYPCDFFVYDHWKLGNWMDAPLHTFLESERYRQFAYQKSKVPACGGCAWRPWCHGGCQKDRMFPGDDLRQPTVLCEAYKTFFAHAAPRLNALAKKMARPRV